ncbi:DUF3422 domain-containing protein [Dechloromonas sp. ZY10]|uniref:DUF3422 family protein n=1 Tax=Dechloromonas aquae TaxID=2664436 RepID=UPI003528E320
MAQAAEGERQHALAVACLAEASDHPARHDLANEVHARPFLRIAAPARVTHLAVLGDPAAPPAQHLQLATEFCEALGIAPPAPAARHLAYNGDGFTLKWERHTEFSTFTVVGSGQADEPFADWIDEGHRLPAGWRTLVDRKRLVALQIEVLKGEPARNARRERSRWFGDSGQVGSRVLGGGEVWCNWQIGDDGFSRFLVLDLDFRENQVGRLVQRLAEIETYRLMALLSLPVAREMLGQLENLEARLGEVIRGMAADHGSGGDADRLLALTELAGQVEALSAGVSRFSASQAYDQLVLSRIQELREERIEGVPTIGEFMERRLSPAMDTCRSVQARQAALAERLSRAIDLLRTRVDMVQERQITELLSGMHSTASTQLKLQHAVEGLSVVAISYYAISLLSHLLRGAEDLGLHVNTPLLEVTLVPAVLVMAFLMIRGVRKGIASGRC